VEQGEKTCTCSTNKEETKICVQCAMKRNKDDQIKKVCGFDQQGGHKKYMQVWR
jgi:hypothetical protein